MEDRRPQAHLVVLLTVVETCSATVKPTADHGAGMGLRLRISFLLGMGLRWRIQFYLNLVCYANFNTHIGTGLQWYNRSLVVAHDLATMAEGQEKCSIPLRTRALLFGPRTPTGTTWNQVTLCNIGTIVVCKLDADP